MRYKAWLSVFLLSISVLAAGQSSTQRRPLTVNGQTGEVEVYQINGHYFVDLESLARVGNGSLSFHGDQIVLSFTSGSATPPAAPPPPSTGMSDGFMNASIQFLSSMKEWGNIITYGLQHGVPGDGSRLVGYRDRSAADLRTATVAASTPEDRSAAALLTNEFNEMERWYKKLVDARKSMNTANYSMSPDALNNDPSYQKLMTCGQFLANMIPSGKFQDNYSCH